MKENDKNRKTRLPDFIKYKKGEMTDLQRHAFERELQMDPFAEEAEEGFSDISPEEAERDLLKLNKQVRARVTNNRIIYYRIAASVAVLMIISSLFIISERNRLKENATIIALNQTPFEIPESKAIALPKASPPSENIQLPEQEGEKKKATRDTEKVSAPVTQTYKPEAPSGLTEGRIARTEISKDDINSVADSVDQEQVEFLAVNDFQNQDKQNPAAAELNEVVVIGYGTSKRSKAVSGVAVTENKDEITDNGYAPPVPVDGKESFDKYIEDNIRKPALLPEGERAVVVISFTVTSSGVIQNIKILRSQGQEYSDEAVRLIKEGPAWKPSEENGEKINEEVRMRIIFR